MKSRMKLTGQVEKMDGDQPPMIAYVPREKGRRRGRLRLKGQEGMHREIHQDDSGGY